MGELDAGEISAPAMMYRFLMPSGVMPAGRPSASSDWSSPE
jgi:hypothetical protein